MIKPACFLTIYYATIFNNQKATTMNSIKLMAFIFVTAISVSASAQIAHPVKVLRDTREIRSDKRDIKADKTDRRKDVKDVMADKKDARQDHRELVKDASHGRTGQVIADKKDLRSDRRDIRGDKRDIVSDTKDIHQDKKDLHHDYLKRRRHTL